MTDDATLLRRYATDRAEDAFAELVRRHLPLVYSAAVRRLGGDTHRAEDVTQVVFCTVARDANRLAAHAGLTGWLYTATRNAVIDVVRSDARRRTREQAAHAAQEIASDGEATLDWSGLRPVLDAALDELPDDDRTAVLLRYFADRSYAEISGTLGLSEDAARKRVDRALVRLGDQLRRHKITSTAAALATLLSAEAIATPPAGLAASLAAAALGTGGATAGVAAFLTAAKLKVGLAAVVLGGAATGLVIQHRALSEQEARTAAAQRYAARVGAENDALKLEQTRLRADPSARPAVVAPSPAGSTAPSTAVAPPAPAPAGAVITLGPLPDTDEIRRQQAYWHRRYARFFQQRGLTSEQANRFVDLKVHQAMARADFQAAVEAANLRGDSHAVQALRAKDDSPVTRGLLELLGREGYAAYATYEISSSYRMIFVEPALPAFAAAGVPLTEPQSEQLLQVFAQCMRHVQARPTDIGTTGHMDWDAVVARAESVLTPEQLTVLRRIAASRRRD